MGQSLAGDLANISLHYAGSERGFWVATAKRQLGPGSPPQSGTEEAVCGCVALDRPHRTSAGPPGVSHGNRCGWGELRRMSVAPWARRQRVAHKLHEALLCKARELGL